MFFWDYGNSFLLEGRRAGADVDKNDGDKKGIDFKYPSYVQDIMGLERLVPFNDLPNTFTNSVF